MKHALSLCAFAFALGLAPLTASAQSKGMGRSAIQAARLKKNPTSSWLAHYLPDDRYKIAGKVWKYVSTDLDTYYHLPSSPNMMRQPADRVIGFASIRDAEEAGYVADPTDGTARVAAAVLAPRPSAGGMMGAGTSAEQAYLARITPIMRDSQRDEAQWTTRLRGAGANSAALGQAFASALPLLRRTKAQLSALRPPQRYTRFHSLLLTSTNQSLTAINSMSRSLAQGTFSIGNLDLSQVINTQRALLAEAQRVGIDPSLLK